MPKQPPLAPTASAVGPCRGWSGGAKVLGKLPVPGRPTILVTVGQGPTALAVGAGGSCLDIFSLIYPFSSLSPSLWETARYRLKYCLKGPLNPKTTNQGPCHTKIQIRRMLQPSTIASPDHPRSGGSVEDSALDYQSRDCRDHRFLTPFLRSFG